MGDLCVISFTLVLFFPVFPLLRFNGRSLAALYSDHTPEQHYSDR